MKKSFLVIFLPRTQEQPVSIPVVSQVRRLPARGRVLLVDDEPLVRDSLARLLRRLGCELMLAPTASEAVRMLKATPHVDLVVTDVIMPEMNGVELIEKLAEMGVRAKVLYISGFPDGVLTRRIGLGDRVDFLAKPLSALQLEDKVRDLLSEGRPQHFGMMQ
jgi:two-component system cell cycle sensor histidine kinase/response regulator CckA